MSASAQPPKRMSKHASGFDLCADLRVPIILCPGKRFLVPTGIALEIPEGFEAQIRPRSGLAIKHGIGILNSPGTIDADYRGEIKIILFNVSDIEFLITPGMRIAQMVFAEVLDCDLEECGNLSPTARDEGGFGHTGI